MRRRSRSQARERDVPQTPAAERLLIDLLPEVPEMRILCTSLGRGKFAAAASRIAGSRVVLHEFDVYLAEQAQRFQWEKRFDAVHVHQHKLYNVIEARQRS